MSKPVKQLLTDEVRRRCEGFDSACVIDISGLDAIKTNLMRGALKKQDIRMHVVKNSQARRALAGGPLGALADSLSGPCALVYGQPPITDIAKELAKWAKEYEVIKLKNGTLEAELYSVQELSTMMGKTELIGEIGMLISSPARMIAGQLRAPASGIAGCLKSLIEKNEAA